MEKKKDHQPCRCGLIWGHTGKHRPPAIRMKDAIPIPKDELLPSQVHPLILKDWEHSLWGKVKWLLKWSLVLLAITGTLSTARIWLEMQETEMACKANGYDQAKEWITAIREATGKETPSKK